ncbi:MAG TPA: aspartate aminotransferase family protein [Chitinophagaceae bacterium]|nr:aspartate aminotransferase family protein [Chitinophagaceae bacterium]
MFEVLGLMISAFELPFGFVASHTSTFRNSIQQMQIREILCVFAQPLRSLREIISSVNERELFLKHIAQTSPSPLAFEIAKAEGCLLYDVKGKEYIDLIGGISVANIGHRHPSVIEAIKKQLDAYMHVMVYGEFIESPQVQYAKLLTDHLPSSLNSVYFTNSGAEAIEGTMKLAKRITNRTQIIAFKNSYHGSTQGALSIIGNEYWRNAFRPLLPDILHLEYNSFESLDEISERTACVIAETVQAEAGIIVPSNEWMQALRKKCTETGTLLILDEIQAGFGRTGKLWGFENFEIVPDVLILGKALGGSMPLGAFIADKKLMNAFTENPILGHITTFGGHPVCCASGMAAMKVLVGEKIVNSVKAKEALFGSVLVHKKIKSIHSFGLWTAIEFDSFEINKKIINACIESGIMTDWFLFASQSLRISPPLIISEGQIKKACKIILQACDTL